MADALAAPSPEALETFLSAALGRPVVLAQVTRPGPWCVVRCRLEGGAPASVIVKWLRQDQLAWRADPVQLATERAGLEFAEAIGFAAAPRLLAADARAGLLAIEDLAPCAALDERIRANGLAHEAGRLAAFGAAMGELAARSIGRRAEFESLHARYAPVAPMALGDRGFGPTWKAFTAVLEAHGAAPSPAATADLAAAEAALREPGPFLAFSNGDPGANNFLVTGRGDGDGRLIDFEHAGFCHAMTAAAQLLIPGPGWITVAGPEANASEDAFRRALAHGVPQAEDDALYGHGLAAACMAWACDRLTRFEAVDARGPAEKGRVQLVAGLESAAAVARRFRVLGDAADWADRAAAWLRRVWPDANVDLSAIPAYTPRG